MYGKEARFGGLRGLPLDDILVSTPSMIIDQGILYNNVERAKKRAKELGVTLRPHLKTHKSIEIARWQMESDKGPATVSTIKEARFFAANGIMDMIYAVTICPQKLPDIAEIRQTGVDMKVVVDSVEGAKIVSEFCHKWTLWIPVLIEIDCDGHRSGLKPNDPTIVEVARACTNGAVPKGVITHAGESYHSLTPELIKVAAENEVKAINMAAKMLRDAGFRCPIVSTGSTPTFMMLDHKPEGVTEMRPGTYALGDLFMMNLGVLNLEDIAGSVLTTVIGHQRAKGQVICDAGWNALSQDRGTAQQAIDFGYGLVCDLHGKPLRNMEVRVTATNQEHGIITAVSGEPLRPEDFPIGSRLRILPNHICATMARYNKLVFLGVDETITKVVPHLSGWS